MKEITISFTNDTARMLEYSLRKRYHRDKRTTLEKLCKFAALEILKIQADNDLE